MASQEQLIVIINLLRAELQNFQARLNAARISSGTSPSGVPLPPDPREIASLEDAVRNRQEQLQNAESELANLNVAAGNQNNDTVLNPLTTPPGTDEFDGIDTQVAANINGLQEPPNVDPNDDPAEAARLEAEQRLIAQETPEYNSLSGLTISKTNAQTQATQQDQANFTKQEDWRVRLSLAPGSNYLYNKKPDPGILKPLADTNGVIFPYTPSIQISYAANYEPTDLTHANYKVYQYKNSAVDNIQISCDFTAQDTYEANYLLAVIHFFRSVTKMFYGQDNGPKPGTPPPLCFLTGLGAFQFNEHPLAIVSFNYTLPTDVDYIRAGQTTSQAGVNLEPNIRPDNSYSSSSIRLTDVGVGGQPVGPAWQNLTPMQPTITYVPTKMQIQISAVPMMSRNDVSNNFSLNDYASGKLLRGMQNVRGGFW